MKRIAADSPGRTVEANADITELREQAAKYRRLAKMISHQETVDLLHRLADDLDAKLNRILAGLNERP